MHTSFNAVLKGRLQNLQRQLADANKRTQDTAQKGVADDRREAQRGQEALIQSAATLRRCQDELDKLKMVRFVSSLCVQATSHQLMRHLPN